MPTCRGDYKRDKVTLQVSVTVHKAGGIKKRHKSERQVNQSHALGNNNFNGAKEVVCILVMYIKLKTEQNKTEKCSLCVTTKLLLCSKINLCN